MTYDESAVRDAMWPFRKIFWSIFDEAYQEWLAQRDWRISERLDPILYPRTKSTYIFDALARVGRRELRDVDGVEVIEEAQTLKFCVGDVAVVRFKKCGPNGLGQNIPTQAVMDFHDPQTELPGLPPSASKVEIVWIADELGQMIDRLIVNSRFGDKLAWSFELDRPVADSGVVTLPTKSIYEEDEQLIRHIRRAEPKSSEE